MWDAGDKHLDIDANVIVRGLDGVFTERSLLWCAQNDAVEAGDFWVMRSQLPAAAPAAATAEASGSTVPWSSSNVRAETEPVSLRLGAQTTAGVAPGAAAPAELGLLGHMLHTMGTSLFCARAVPPVWTRSCFSLRSDNTSLSTRVRHAQAGARLLESYLRIVYADGEQRWRAFRNGTIVSGSRDSRLVLSSSADLADCTICRERFNERMYPAESERVRAEFRVDGNWDAVVFHGLKTTIFVVLPHDPDEDDAKVGRNATAIAQLDAGKEALAGPQLDAGEAAGLAMVDMAGRLTVSDEGVG